MQCDALMVKMASVMYHKKNSFRIFHVHGFQEGSILQQVLTSMDNTLLLFMMTVNKMDNEEDLLAIVQCKFVTFNGAA